MTRIALLLVCLLPSLALAQENEADKLLEEMTARLYIPRDNGLKDVRFRMGGSLGALLGSTQLDFIWKAGVDGERDKANILVKGGKKKGLKQQLIQQAKGPLTETLSGFFAGPMAMLGDLWKHADATVKTGRKNSKIVTLVRKPDAPKSVDVSKATIVIDKKGVLQSITATRASETITLKPRFTKRKDKLLMTEQTVKRGTRSARATLGWIKKDDIWLPGNLKARGMTFKFSRYQVNEGIDDALFAEGAGSETPKKK